MEDPIIYTFQEVTASNEPTGWDGIRMRDTLQYNSPSIDKVYHQVCIGTLNDNVEQVA